MAIPHTWIQGRRNLNKCLAKKNSSNWRNGNPIHVWDCEYGVQKNKNWTYEHSTGYIRGVENPSKCMAKKGNSDWNNGDRVHVWDCADSLQKNVRWLLP